jgi:hypothetical protein
LVEKRREYGSTCNRSGKEESCPDVLFWSKSAGNMEFNFGDGHPDTYPDCTQCITRSRLSN